MVHGPTPASGCQKAISYSCTSQKKPARNRSFRSGFLFVLSMKMQI